jgi:hypothetical protein
MALLPADPKPLVNLYVDSLVQRVRNIIDRHQSDPQADFWKPETMLRDAPIRGDIERLNDICRLTSISRSYIDLINTELEAHGLELRVDETFFESN